MQATITAPAASDHQVSAALAVDLWLPRNQEVPLVEPGEDPKDSPFSLLFGLNQEARPTITLLTDEPDARLCLKGTNQLFRPNETRVVSVGRELSVCLLGRSLPGKSFRVVVNDHGRRLGLGTLPSA